MLRQACPELVEGLGTNEVFSIIRPFAVRPEPVEGFFALLRMTALVRRIVKCTNLVCFDLGQPRFFLLITEN
jgi:hypothetical protein